MNRPTLTPTAGHEPADQRTEQRHARPEHGPLDELAWGRDRGGGRRREHARLRGG